MQLWPHGCLRDAYEAGSPLGSIHNRCLPAGVPATRSRIFLLIEYPHTTLSPVAPRRLSTRAKLQTHSPYSPDYIVIHLHPPRPESFSPSRRPVVYTVSHAYPYGLICALIGTLPTACSCRCLRTCKLQSSTAQSRLSCRLALPCSLPQLCACPQLACVALCCVHTACCRRSPHGFGRSSSPRCPPRVFLQPSWYSPHFSPPAIFQKFPCPFLTLFSPKPLARISLPPSHLTLWPSALPCPVLFLPSYDSHSPAPRPQHPRLSGGSTPPAFCLGIHSQSAAILLACTMMQPSV